MKSLRQFIQEKLVIKKSKNNNYKYFPETKRELKDIIKQRIEQEGNEMDLNDIETSKITDMSELFSGLDFNGDISQWDVSNVVDMSYMFYGCKKFNQDISKWNTQKVKASHYMFYRCPIEEKYKPKFK